MLQGTTNMCSAFQFRFLWFTVVAAFDHYQKSTVQKMMERFCSFNPERSTTSVMYLGWLWAN